MDWSNERYVRLYTRDTTTWKLLSWEGKYVLMSLLRKVDRSGVLDVGEDGIEGLAALIEVPLFIAEVGVPQLLKRETLVQRDTLYVMPNFLPAQEAKQSDAMRKREERERRRHNALAGTRHANDEFPDNPSRNVTANESHADDGFSDKASRNVTESGNASRNVTDSYESRTNGHVNPLHVTPSLAEPILAEPSQGLPRARDPGSTESVLPLPAPIVSVPRETRPPAPSTDPTDDRWCTDRWDEVNAHRARIAAAKKLEQRPLHFMDPGRRDLVDRLREGFSREDIAHAIAVAVAEAERTGALDWLDGGLFKKHRLVAAMAKTPGVVPARAGPHAARSQAAEPIRRIRDL
jgi:hypothetical protein